MSSGYSGTPLVKKLGIKPGFRIAIINAPDAYAETLGDLPPDVEQVSLDDAPLDFVHCFVASRTDLESAFPDLKAAIELDGMIWISWYKKSSGMPTDLDGNAVREIGLANGLVDVKVAAVDGMWSGLKFMYRKRDRT